MISRLGFLSRALAGLLLAAVSVMPAAAQSDGKVVIFAAASMKTALDAALVEWKKETSKDATVSYASSAVIARQIEQGAPADMFISADLEWMDWLQQRNLIKPETRKTLLGNALVLVFRGLLRNEGIDEQRHGDEEGATENHLHRLRLLRADSRVRCMKRNPSCSARAGRTRWPVSSMADISPMAACNTKDGA